MKSGALRKWSAVWWLIGLLLLSGLACAQAGEVLTPAEATARAEGRETEIETVGVDTVDEEGLQVGDTATLLGRSFLINILDEPGGRIIANQERGVIVTIQQIAEQDGERWYQIQAPTGTGWVTEENLEAVEEEEVEGGGETAEEGTLSEGDEVFLVGTGFIVNFLREPGGIIVAGQERGARATILEATTYEGETWYRIRAATGEGWVPEENVTTEQP